MGRKIQLDENKIIKEYENGKSSLKLADKYNVSKPVILRILRKANVIRKRNRCDKLDIRFDGKSYYIYWKCPRCGKRIKKTANHKTILCRNYYNLKSDSICKKCSLDLQTGEGNPFYGKTHTKKSKQKMSRSRKGKCCGDKNPSRREKVREKLRNCLLERMSNGAQPVTSMVENEILKHLKENNNVVGSFKIGKYIYDFYFPDINLIIEFNGDYWHCNPKKYNSGYYHSIINLTASDIWKRDEEKIDFATKLGYTCEVIWENDYYRDPQIINETIKKYEH